MIGILKLAYKLLVNDKAKFTALLVGITFAVFLMIQMLAMFAGVLKRVVRRVQGRDAKEAAAGHRADAHNDAAVIVQLKFRSDAGIPEFRKLGIFDDDEAVLAIDVFNLSLD